MRRAALALGLIAILTVGRAYASCPAQLAANADIIAFPPDSGIVDVTQFGAVPNDDIDDTDAVFAAIAASREQDQKRGRIYPPLIYFPPGTYIISRPLEKRDAKGYLSGLILQGAGRDLTVLRLADGLPAYQDTQHPRSVIFTSSHLWEQGGPFAGGKNWPELGEGNQAFQNTVRDLTVNVGKGNPGAIGIDYLANNNGALRNLRICSEDNAAQTGLVLTRKWPGPALVNNVDIDGFTIGIDISNRDYGMVFDGVRLLHIGQIGFRNRGNAASLSDVAIEDAPQPIVNDTASGLIAARALSLGVNPAPAFAANRGLLLIAQGANAGAWLGDKALATKNLHNLPNFPRFPLVRREAVSLWQSVNTRPGGDPAGDTDALAAAVTSGARTVYLPYKMYRLDRAIILPAKLERIVGLNSAIELGPAFAEQLARGEVSVFVTKGKTDKPLVIEDLRIRDSRIDEKLRERLSIIEHEAARPLVLTDVMVGGGTSLRRKASGGTVFLDNVSGCYFVFEGPAPIYARQLNTEGRGVRIRNDGAMLWALGVKSESPNTLVDTRGGGRSIVWGGLVYPLRQVPPELPLFTTENATLNAVVVQSSNKTDDHYQTIAVTDKTSSTIPIPSVPRFLQFGILAEDPP